MLALNIFSLFSLFALPAARRGWFGLRDNSPGAGGRRAGSSNAPQDHLGSIRVLTDEDGGVTERTTWGPWGERFEGGELSRVGYTGHQTERESGLRYSVHRYLDPRNGRWTRRDPLGDVDGQNRYRYATNRPILASDSSGLRVSGVPYWAEYLIEASEINSVRKIWEKVQCEPYNIAVSRRYQAFMVSDEFSDQEVGVTFARKAIINGLSRDSLPSFLNGRTIYPNPPAFSTTIWEGAAIAKRTMPSKLKRRASLLSRALNPYGSPPQRRVLQASFLLEDSYEEQRRYLTSVILHELTHAVRIYEYNDFAEDFAYGVQAVFLEELGILRAP